MRSTPDALDTSLSRWKTIIREMPDARLDKITAARDALRCNRYEGETVLDETVRRLCDDVGEICLGEPGVS